MHKNFRCSGFLSPLWEWKRMKREWKRRERLHGEEWRGTQKLVVPWVRVGIGFYSIFCALPEGGDVSQVQTEVSWEGEVSPWPLITFWDLLQSIFHSPLSMVTLNAVRNGDDKAYSVTASCSQGAMKGPRASGLTTRGVVDGTAIVGCFHLHQRHL
jgi:hypothetical protein